MAIAVITAVSTSPLAPTLDAATTRRESQWAVRRPLLGTFLSRETFATLTLENFSPTTEEAGLANSSAPPKDPATSTANFILQTVQEQRIEKSQILTTFGTSYAYFFGEQPRQLEVTALLLNTPNFRWDLEWFHNYENFLRGSKLTSSNTVAVFSYDNCIVRGYLTSCSLGKTSDNPKAVPLSFSMFVLDVYYDETIARSRRAVLGDQENFPDYGEPMLPAYTNLLGLKTVTAASFEFYANFAWDNKLEYVAGHTHRPTPQQNTVIPISEPAISAVSPETITQVSAGATTELPASAMFTLTTSDDLADAHALIAENRAASRIVNNDVIAARMNALRQGPLPTVPTYP